MISKTTSGITTGRTLKFQIENPETLKPNDRIKVKHVRQIEVNCECHRHYVN